MVVLHASPRRSLSTTVAGMVLLLATALGHALVEAASSEGQRRVRPCWGPATPLGSPSVRPVAELAAGRFLVASRQLTDPNFSETVVLLVAYDREGAMGVVINRPTEVQLSAVLPEVEGSQQQSDTVYLGGPVARSHLLLLIRSDTPPEEAQHVTQDIYISTSRDLLRQVSAEGRRRFRVYAGYAGWAPGQLDQEVARGDWRVLQADAETVFDKAPAQIWPELIRRGPLQWAGVSAPAQRPGRSMP